MATQLQLVNRVLLRLREDQVQTTIDNDYSTLIAEFVRDSVEESLDHHMWESFKRDIVVDIVPGQAVYELTRTTTDGGDVRAGTLPVTANSELQWIDDDIPEVGIFDSDSDEQSSFIGYITPEMMRTKKRQDRGETDPNPSYFTVYQKSDTATTKFYLELYPAPTAARVFEGTFWARPDELATDGTTDSQDILVPNRPVFLMTLFFALNERGEEIGEPGNVAETKAISALDLAVERDLNTAQRGDRYDWRRD